MKGPVVPRDRHKRSTLEASLCASEDCVEGGVWVWACAFPVQTHGRPTQAWASPLPISPTTEMTGPCHQVHLVFKVVNSSSFMNMYGNPKIYIHRHQMHSGTKGDQKRALDTPKLNLLMIMSQSLGFGTRTQVFWRAVSVCNQGAISPEVGEEKILRKENRAMGLVAWSRDAHGRAEVGMHEPYSYTYV